MCTTAWGTSIQGFGALPPAPCFPSPALLEKAVNSGIQGGTKLPLDVPCSSRERGGPRARREPIFHPALPPSGHGLQPRGSAAAPSPAPTRDNLTRPLADGFMTSELPCLCLDHACLLWASYHCSHTSQEPQKAALKIQAWDKSNLPKLFSLSLTLPVTFQPFLNAFYFIRTLSISELWKMPSYPWRLFAL